jgi:hypothetical protein
MSYNQLASKVHLASIGNIIIAGDLPLNDPNEKKQISKS